MRLQSCKLKQKSHSCGPFLNVIREFWLAPGSRQERCMSGGLSACEDSAFKEYTHVSLYPLLLSPASVKLALQTRERCKIKLSVFLNTPHPNPFTIGKALTTLPLLVTPFVDRTAGSEDLRVCWCVVLRNATALSQMATSYSCCPLKCELMIFYFFFKLLIAFVPM